MFDLLARTPDLVLFLGLLAFGAVLVKPVAWLIKCQPSKHSTRSHDNAETDVPV